MKDCGLVVDILGRGPGAIFTHPNYFNSLDENEYNKRRIYSDEVAMADEKTLIRVRLCSNHRGFRGGFDTNPAIEEIDNRDRLSEWRKKFYDPNKS